MSDVIEHAPAVPPRLQPLHAQIAEQMVRLRVPGVGLGILEDGAEHVAGFGVTNVDHPAPVAGETLFQNGSITKTLTALAAMRLVEAGTLELDAPVRTYLPDLRVADAAVAAAVTMRHLLTHTAGWEGDYLIFTDRGRGDDALASFITQLADLPQLTPLGTVWAYNNAGFYLAGRVIEVLTGQTFEQALRELVLAPLGMHHAFFFPEEVMLHSFAVGHHEADGKPKVAAPWPIPRSANPAGGITSNPPDLLRYARFQLGDGTAADGTRLLTRESLDRLHTPVQAAGPGESIGLAWFIRDVGGVRLLRHGGGTNGQIALLLCAPARDFALVLLTNSSRGGELIDHISDWALREYLGIVEPEPAPLALSAAELAPFVGRYVSTLNLLELSLRDASLQLDVRPNANYPGDPPPPPPSARVAFAAPDQLVILDGPMQGAKGEFLRGPDGSLAWLRLGGRLHRYQA